jgi:ferredoxin
MTFKCNLPQFHQLLDSIKSQGYKLLGPTRRHDAIVFDEIESAGDLPMGWTDEQNPGYYRLKRSNNQAYFSFHASQDSWKKYLFPSREHLWSMDKKSGEGTTCHETKAPDEKWAFIGIHPCDLHSLSILDKVFSKKLTLYQQYHQRRKNTLIVAVSCTTSSNTCFCASMGTGPELNKGYDLGLTEMIDGKDHFFLVSFGSTIGQSLCEALKLPLATQAECQIGSSLVAKNKKEMKRSIANDRLHEMLMKSWHYQRWDQVAKRCINCANCTMVCPTCFCSNIDDKVSLDGSHVDRIQSWESCFNLSHSYVHGGSVRSSSKSRYRQWLTHKFGTWWDQFEMSGCVGCGRCITWCPVGIDVTEELNQLQAESKQ